jgi:uncharacterized protein YkwD
MRLAAIGVLATLAAQAAAQPAKGPVADAAAAANLIIERTNDFRRSSHLDAVQVDPRLDRAALEFARFMARTGKYGHEVDGRDPPARATADGYDYCLVLENIAYHYDSRGFETRRLAFTAVEGWKSSPQHRKNMENPLVIHTGVGVARGANGYYYSVQMFGLPRSASIKFEVRNESRLTVRYRVGGEAHTVPPRSIRTHEVCMHEPVRFEGEAEAVEPKSGDRFVIPEKGGEVRRERR